MKQTWEERAYPGTCGVCNKKADVIHNCIPGIPCTTTYCKSCWKAGAEPLGIMAQKAVASGVEVVEGRVKATLPSVGKTWAEFEEMMERVKKNWNDIDLPA